MNEKFIWHEGDVRLYQKDIEITGEQRARANERIDQLIVSIDQKSRKPAFKDKLSMKGK